MTHSPHEVIQIAHSYYEEKLTSDSWAYDYLKTERGLEPQTIAASGAGYAPEGWTGLTEFLRKQGVSDEAMIDAGVARKSNRTGSLYDTYRHRVVFPIRNEEGTVLGFAGRKHPDDKSEMSPKWLTPSNNAVFEKRTTLYGMERLPTNDGSEVFISEGVFDKLAVERATGSPCVALMGTALTDEHCEFLKNNGITTVNMVLDPDTGGFAGNANAWNALNTHGLKGYAIILPSVDPGAASDEILSTAVAVRRPLLDFTVDHQLSPISSEHEIEKRVSAARHLAVILSQVAPEERAAQLDRVGKQLKLAPETVDSLIEEMEHRINGDSNQLESEGKEIPNFPPEAPSEDQGHLDADPAEDIGSAPNQLKESIESAEPGSVFTVHNDNSLANQEVNIPEKVHVNVSGTSSVGTLTGAGSIALTDQARAECLRGKLTAATLEGRSSVLRITDEVIVENLKGKGSVRRINGSVTLRNMTDAASAGFIGEQCKVGRVDGNSQIGTLTNTVEVESISGKSKIGVLGGEVFVKHLGGETVVGHAQDKTAILRLDGEAVIREVSGQTRIKEMADQSRCRLAKGHVQVGSVGEFAGIDEAREYVIIHRLKGSVAKRDATVRVLKVDPGGSLGTCSGLTHEQHARYQAWKRKHEQQSGKDMLNPRYRGMKNSAGNSVRQGSRMIHSELRREMAFGETAERVAGQLMQ